MGEIPHRSMMWPVNDVAIQLLGHYASACSIRVGRTWDLPLLDQADAGLRGFWIRSGVASYTGPLVISKGRIRRHHATITRVRS